MAYSSALGRMALRRSGGGLTPYYGTGGLAETSILSKAGPTSWQPTGGVEASGSYGNTNYFADQQKRWNGILHADAQNTIDQTMGSVEEPISGIGEGAIVPGMGDASLNIGTTPDTNWFTDNKDMLSGIGSGIQAAAGLANAFVGYKNYQLGKDRFALESQLAKANYTNQAQSYNSAVDRGASVTQGLAGSRLTDPDGFAARVQKEKVKETL